ncbi:MAG: Vitamin B12 dependent methionine synthase activation subunit [Ruminococcaceae bacterium]|nr:Vitamin B12 dependent methionine synthase activation subunit [Oscillospiraceae bacterium]
MINSTPIIKSFSPPRVNRREILRYMGCASEDASTGALIDRSLVLCQGKLRYDIACAEFPILINGNVIDTGFAKICSHDLSKCLAGCDSIVVFAATVGLELDRLIAKYGKTEPSVSLCLQAIGAERIEALCDAFCSDLENKLNSQGKRSRPRFSAGYGDVSLEVQKHIFAALDCHKSIGLTLNESLLMSPTKSVTAIVGIKNSI